MARRRLGVVVVVPGDAAAAVNGLRRAVGTDVRRIDPHITLVPPVNVHEGDVAAALTVLRSAAERTAPFELVLGPAATFEPVSPVLYLEVGGASGPLTALRDRVFTAPLARPLSHPFHPHVTLGEDLPSGRTGAAVTAMASFTVEVVVDRVQLLEEQRVADGRRVWRTVADATFGAPAVIGRGGLPLELRVSGPPDAAGQRLLQGGDPPATGRPLTVTGWRDGEVVGVATGVTSAGTARLDAVVVAERHRRQGAGRHLLVSFETAARAAGATAVVAGVVDGSPLLALCRGAGWVERARLPGSPPDAAGLLVVERRLG